MGSARILGCAVNVEKTALPDDNVLYTVTGEGASALHTICDNHHTNPGKLEGDSFTIKQSSLQESEFARIPAVAAIRDALTAATKTKKLS